ncbi:MAG: cytochrome P450 [Acidimicrobiales bacterium]|nr:cytochrome P450 [Acidimicrobiales bacterium]
MGKSVYVPRSGESWRNPYPMYSDLRDNSPVHFVEDGSYWFLSRFEDVFNAARSPNIFSSRHGLTIDQNSEYLEMGDATPIVFLDPPEHTQFRRLISKGFTPRKAEDMRQDINSFVEAAIKRIKELENCDIISELFKPLPSFVVSKYLGVPTSDRMIFDTWTEKIVAGAVQNEDSEGLDAIIELTSYFTEMIEWRKSKPGDDLISELLEMGEEKVSIMWILGLAFTMIAGGNDTTTGLLGGSAVLLTENPDQRKLLLEDLRLLPEAIEELLRMTSPVQGLSRVLLEDFELQGEKIPSGSRVLIGYGSGNRDEREFGKDSEKLNIRRKIKRTLGFGSGAHLCLGASVARLQSSIALKEILRNFPDFYVDESSSTYATGNYVRRHTHLAFYSSD